MWNLATAAALIVVLYRNLSCSSLIADANNGQAFGSTVMAAVIGIVVPIGK